jgi:hypothetical protein
VTRGIGNGTCADPHAKPAGQKTRWAAATLAEFLGPPPRPRKRLSAGEARLARLLVPGAVTVIGRIFRESDGTDTQGVALFTYLRYLFPLPPLLEPLPRSGSYRIRRLAPMAEDEQIKEWVLAIDRGQSILGSRGLALLLPFYRR